MLLFAVWLQIRDVLTTEWSKGGFGPIHRNLLVATRSKDNALYVVRELLTVGDGKTAQTVIVWRNHVYELNALPADFKLDESTIISFGDKRADITDYKEDGASYHYCLSRADEELADGKGGPAYAPQYGPQPWYWGMLPERC